VREIPAAQNRRGRREVQRLRVNVTAILRIEEEVVRALAHLLRQHIFRNLHASQARWPQIFEITIASEMQSQFALFAREIALRTRAQIEERSLPRIEAVIARVDVLREQALEPRGRQFRQSR